MAKRDSHPENIFARRMYEMRLASGFSQRELGLRSGIDESVAAVRINRYELGVHSPDYLTAKRIAASLQVPLPYLYCEDDDLGQLIVAFAEGSKDTRKRILATFA